MMICYNGMNSRLPQKLIAVVVIAALLQLVGVAPFVIAMLACLGLGVSYIVQRSAYRETQRIFTFYVAAEEVLRNEDRHWYGFEVAELIDQGEKVMSSIADVPPVCQFAVGALCHRVGDYEAAVEHLTPIVQPQAISENSYSTPSLQLRRYVEMLRSIEREPAKAPAALGAIRSLERMRQKYAAKLLLESRNHLTGRSPVSGMAANLTSEFSTHSVPGGTGDPHVPRSISEVLQDVYPDERKPS